MCPIKACCQTGILRGLLHRQSTRTTFDGLLASIARKRTATTWRSFQVAHRFSGVEPRLFDLQDDSLFRVNRARSFFQGRCINFLQLRNQRDLAKTRVCSLQTVFKVAQLALGKGKVFDLQRIHDRACRRAGRVHDRRQRGSYW